MIPLDLEEVFGGAVADAVRRGLALFACLFLASTLAAFSLGLGEAISALGPAPFFEGVRRWVMMWMMPFLGMWVFLYVPVLLVLSYRFFTEDSLVPQPFLRFLGVLSVLMLVAFPGSGWSRVVQLVILVGSLAIVRSLAFMYTRYLWWRFEKRLGAIAAANRENRKRLEREFGTEGTRAADNEERRPHVDEGG